MKAIETEYDGYRFRSRREARWAVFFDALDIRYLYEVEGYDLDGEWYLPDFWLRDKRLWLEVKGEEPAEAEFVKATKLAQASGEVVVIAWGYFEDAWRDNVCFWTDGDGVFRSGRDMQWLSIRYDELEAANKAAKSARFERGNYV